MAEITTLLNFNFANGEHPVGSLVEDAAGDLFGTAVTQSQGVDDMAQVFEIAKTVDGYASAPTVLGTISNVLLTPIVAIDASGNLLVETNTYNETGAKVYELAKSDDDYAAPSVIANVAGELSGNLLIDSFSNLIGVSGGVVYELKTAGSNYLSTPYTLAALPTVHVSGVAYQPVSAVVTTDSAGDLFVAVNGTSPTRYGVDTAVGLYELAKTQTGYASTLQLIASFSDGGFDSVSVNVGFSVPSVVSLSVDGSGNIFGDIGGASDDYAVFKINKTGDAYASSPTFLPDPTNTIGASGPLVTDANGNLFAATTGSDESYYQNYGKIFAELPSPSGAYSEDDLVAFDGANGSHPNSVLIGPDGALYGTTEYGGVNDDGVLFRVALFSLSIGDVSVSASGQLTISGKIDLADMSEPVSIYEGDDLLGVATPSANGDWSATLAQSIASGESAFNVVASSAYNQTISRGVDLFYDTNNQWGATNGANGAVYLDNAQVSVTAGGASVYLIGSNDWASLYNTSGDWDTVTGDDGSVILTGSQASIFGGGDQIYFNGQSDSAVSLYATKGNWDKATGDDGSLTLVNAQVSVFGGYDTVYLDGSADDAASLYNTGGHWDTVYGDDGSVTLNGTQASVIGQGDSIYFAPATYNQVTLYNNMPHGIADNVVGSNGLIYFSYAQSAVTGGSNVLHFIGQDDAADLYATSGDWDTVNATGASLTLHAAQASVLGGGDTVHLDGSTSNAASLYNTGGDWDTVFGDDGALTLTGAQASLLGHGDYVYFDAGVSNAVSLYWTYGVDDHVVGSNGSITLVSAQADVQGDGDYLYLSGASAAAMTGANESFGFQAAIGEATIGGFVSSDIIQFSSADFANYQALSGHITQSGDDAVITYDANDKVTLTNTTASSLTAANFKFA